MSGLREMSDKYLIVGLGNPGKKYADTRHNVGFWVVDELAQRHNISVTQHEKQSLTGSGSIGDKRVLLVKPQTFMNNSGQAVQTLLRYYKISLDRLIIIHDDLDTPLGTLRIRKNGGHGGQNGVRDIIRHLGTRDFNRIRFGIGRPPGNMQPVQYVLKPFRGDDKTTSDITVARSADAVELWLREGTEMAMSFYNGDGSTQEAPPQQTPEEVLEVAQRAHELNPQDPKPLKQMISAYRRLKQDQAVAYTYMKLGELYLEQDDPQKVITAWEQAVKIRPSFLDVQYRIAESYVAMGNKKRAIQRYLKIIDEYETKGEYETAIKVANTALELNEQHPLVQAKLKDLTTQTNLVE